MKLHNTTCEYGQYYLTYKKDKKCKEVCIFQYLGYRTEPTIVRYSTYYLDGKCARHGHINVWDDDKPYRYSDLYDEQAIRLLSGDRWELTEDEVYQFVHLARIAEEL